jgi:hypothetical protein
MVSNQFNISQTGSGWDPTNTALSGYSLKSDMLTSAYFNAEVGDLRQQLANYQIKIDTLENKHRSIFVGGHNLRDGTAFVPIDVNAGNYPLDVPELDTNTGLSWKKYLGIPNMKLKGYSFSSEMPIYPLTNNNGSIKIANLSNSVLEKYKNVNSLMDTIQLLKNIFGLSTITMNLKNTKNDSNIKYDPITKLGNISNLETITSDSTNKYTPVNNVYISLTSAVTHWVKVAKIEFSIGSIVNQTYPGLNNGVSPINILTAKDIVVKLIIDGLYCPRQVIGNGMSHQQLFIWCECNLGNPSDRINSVLQFTLSNYLVYPKNTINGTQLVINANDSNDFQVSIVFGNVIPPTAGQYLYTKAPDPLNAEVIYKVISITTVNNVSTIILDNHFSNTDIYTVKVLSTSDLNVYKSERFNIDEIRDRYSLLQLLAHVGKIYRTSTGLSLPLKLMEYMAQVKTTESLNNLLEYIFLSDLYSFGGSNTVDVGNKVHQIFHFIQEDKNFYSFVEGGNYGRALRYWDDLCDCVVSNDSGRFSCLNTNEQIIYPADWNKGTSSSPTGKIPCYKTKTANKIKHVVVTNLPGFNNGRYGTSMSSSNTTNGYFGSLSIDVSFSDTHTPVDVNGMTIHQWNLNSTNAINGDKDPSKWNVNANDDYRNQAQMANINL